MTLTLIIAAVTAVAMILSVIFLPYIKIGKAKIGLYYIITLIGAIFLLVTDCVPISFVLDGITADTSVNPLKILALFLSMTLLSIYLGNAGFFDFIADKILLKTKGSTLKLFLILYLTVAILTVFTSNDIIILTFTPPICIFCKKAKISPLPFLFGEFIAANTWSMMLIVGNPTNIYLAQSFGISFTDYFKTMWLPTIFGGILSLLCLTLLFRKDLKIKTENVLTKNRSSVKIDKVCMIVAIIHLIICITLLAISNILGLEMWIICVILALSLTLFNLLYGLIKDKSFKRVSSALKKAPYELIPFVLSMFTIVLALKNCGFTDLIASLLVKNDKTDVTFTFISALSSNLLNNIPMSVLFEKIIEGKSIIAIYSTIIGSNIGAFLTPVGALAGIMWNKILSDYDLKLPFYKFVLYGGITAIIALIFSSLGLILIS